MRRRFRARLARYSLAALLTILVAGLALRWHGRRAALAYGHAVQNTLFSIEQEARRGTEGRRIVLLEEPEVLAAQREMTAWWNPVALDYRSRAEEMRAGLTYLQLQLTLPSTQRFRNKPTFRHFRVETLENTDAAVRGALRKLVEDYLDYAGTR
jgi:hypothetical protein